MKDRNSNDLHKATLPQTLYALRLRMQLAWAEWMEAKVAHLSRKGQYVAFGLFMAIATGFCTLMLFGGVSGISGFMAKPDAVRSVAAPQISSPKVPPDDSLLLERIASVHYYWDSLSGSASGRKTRDSLLQARPGLMDSIRMAEQLIATQKQNRYEKQ